MNKKIDVSIIAPAHNEEQIIGKFLQNVTIAAKQLSLRYEFIIIENGSNDKTVEKVNYFLLSNKNTKRIQLEEAGYGLAILEGFKQASGDYIVFYNVDFWDQKFLELTKIGLLGYDIISSSKLLPGSKDKRGIGRKWVTKMYSLFLKIVFAYKGTDTHGIKVLRRKTVAKVINKCKTKTGIIDSEYMIRAERANLKILELPVEVEEIRPARFSKKRLFGTPLDIVNLYTALK